jgi:rhodanese-related sulfurtransferase
MSLHSVHAPSSPPALPEADDAPATGLSHPLLERRRLTGAAYAGDLPPAEAWELVQSGVARLVDVRTPEERKFVGYVPGSIAVAWMTGTSFQRNPRFLRELEAKLGKEEVLLFLCRSGSRSLAAAKAAQAAGFSSAFNVLEGFEGELDERGQRGALGGWRHHELPWIQD